MNMIEIHESALIGPNSAYHEFLSRYKKFEKIIYGFVEGKEDPSFYRGFIDSTLPHDWHVELWPAGNRSRVLKIHNLFDWRRFNKSRICFFVDRDLSSLIPEKISNDKNIYITSGYSIENSMVNGATCYRVLSELCGFSNTDHAQLDGICDLFEEQLQEFLKQVILIMAWILVWQKSGERPNLKSISMSDLFSIRNGRVIRIATAGNNDDISIYLHRRCGINLKQDIDISIYEEYFIENEIYKLFVRGKFVFWFLIEFCNSIHRDSVSLFKGLEKPPKMHVNLSPTNGMLLIGTRARMPNCLREFIESTFLEYIKAKGTGVN